ncbi:small-subunit processome [Zychaea mexicana]|uniref:small-subunit processome n=1 Tax=Zychaea mexicana TaxID=64656 RepID=UPI0022FE2F59|nr:small-subunit processome [Zychaea mexicana]KAI9489694.1 small-subunit processome [Zychaea mexicana]
MSSSMRNAVHRRNHRERGQLAGRERLGLLEKKKDYLLRAKDFHSKQRRLKALREKALARNPDEFYFKMINSQTKGGVHIQKRNEALPHEMVQLMKSQDKNYIKMQRDISKKKMEKLRDSLHFLDEQLDDEDMLNVYEEDEEEEETPMPQKNNHVVFVDSAEQAKSFDPAKHLDTLPELVNRKFNRPRVETLRNNEIIAPENAASLKALRKEREAKYKEFTSRASREADLQQVERELEIQRAMQAKGDKKKVGVDKNGLAVYKWKARRSK